MDTWGITKPKKERDITENLFSKYEKKKPRANSEASELREKYSLLLNRPFRQISGLTKGWTNEELYRIYNEAIKFTPNPQALLWTKIKHHNLIIKQQLNK